MCNMINHHKPKTIPSLNFFRLTEGKLEIKRNNFEFKFELPESISRYTYHVDMFFWLLGIKSFNSKEDTERVYWYILNVLVLLRIFFLFPCEQGFLQKYSSDRQFQDWKISSRKCCLVNEWRNTSLMYT